MIRPFIFFDWRSYGNNGNGLSGQLRTTCRNLLRNRRMGLDPGTGFCTGCSYTSEGGMFAREINTVGGSAGSGGWWYHVMERCQ